MRSLASYQSVAVWAQGLRQHWGGDPLAEEPEKLRNLEAFCQFFHKDPDELVTFCFLRRRATGERFVSKKRREGILRALKQMQAESGLSAIESRRRSNDVISFLRHNGVLI